MRALEIMIPQDIILVFSLKQLHKIRQNIDIFVMYITISGFLSLKQDIVQILITYM